MNRFDWVPEGDTEDTGFFNKIKPEEVLYDFDGPRIYTFKAAGLKFLAYLCDEEVDTFRHIVVPTDDRTIDALKRGYTSVRDALKQPWTWVVDISGNGLVTDVWKTVFQELPEDVLPEKDAMLYPSLDPVFSVRLVGDSLHEGMIPASVIKRGVDGAYAALKRISQELLDAMQPGRPARALKQLFDLPTQRMAFGSFEISFGRPSPAQQLLPSMDAFDEQLAEMGRRLDAAISWAHGASREVPSLDLLEAVSKLAPPMHGPVEEVQVWGRILPHGHHALNRQASSKIRRTLMQMKAGTEDVLNVIGVPTELDKERMSFRLKPTDGSPDYVCRFQDDHYDELIDVFSSDNITVLVTLKIQKGARIGDVVEMVRHTG